jgi:hypothetical protein
MSEQVLKPEKDFSKEVDQQLPEAEKLAAVCPAMPSPPIYLIADHIFSPTFRERLRSSWPSRNRPDK